MRRLVPSSLYHHSCNLHTRLLHHNMYLSLSLSLSLCLSLSRTQQQLWWRTAATMYHTLSSVRHRDVVPFIHSFVCYIPVVIKHFSCSKPCNIPSTRQRQWAVGGYKYMTYLPAGSLAATLTTKPNERGTQGQTRQRRAVCFSCVVGCSPLLALCATLSASPIHSLVPLLDWCVRVSERRG